MATASPMIAAFAPPALGAAATARPESWRYSREGFDDEHLVVIPNQTPEDFERYAPEMQFCEFFDGVIYMPSPVADRHQELTGFLLHLFDFYHCTGRAGQVLTGPAVLRLSPQRKPEPDLFIRPTSAQAAEGGAFPGTLAVLVVEVLSPSNRGYDLNFKGSFYRQAGISEVWYVDDRDRGLVVDRNPGDGYRTEYLTEGLVEPLGVPGFRLDVGWLWQDPLPNWVELVRDLLAPPA
jgi:Uma2 family endonuclease